MTSTPVTRVVPVEPTKEMIAEVENASRLGGIWDAKSIYKSMLAAAPAAPAPEPVDLTPDRVKAAVAFAQHISLSDGYFWPDYMRDLWRVMNGLDPTYPDATPSSDDSKAVRVRACLETGEASAAARDVLAERRRQVEQEGWTPEHDDEHTAGEMSIAAAVYAMHGKGTYSDQWLVQHIWPWELSWWRPTTPRRNLVKACALILADIERMDRASPPPAAEEGR